MGEFARLHNIYCDYYLFDLNRVQCAEVLGDTPCKAGRESSAKSENHARIADSAVAHLKQSRIASGGGWAAGHIVDTRGGGPPPPRTV
jgi:hypothetical protein